jgi:hypothetical protein
MRGPVRSNLPTDGDSPLGAGPPHHRGSTGRLSAALAPLLSACAMGPACLPIDTPSDIPKPAAVMALQAEGLTFCLKGAVPLPLQMGTL